MPVTAPAAPAATVKTRRREIPFGSVMARCPALIVNGMIMSCFAVRRLDLAQADLRRPCFQAALTRHDPATQGHSR
jgi:hypothetical protein